MWPLIFAAAIFLTALMLCCIWVASDYGEWPPKNDEDPDEWRKYK